MQKNKPNLSTLLGLETALPEDNGITVYDLILCFIACTSLLAIILIAANHFNVPLLLGLGMALTIAAAIPGRKAFVLKDARMVQPAFLLVMGLALIFRLGSFTHYSGGQDQGLYVSMSETLVRNGGVNIYDPFRAGLPENLKRIYDQEELMGTHLEDAGKSLDQIDFYPLNGAWLAVFGAVFGTGKFGYSIQFFSLLVVAGVYLLTLELTGNNKKAANLAMLFAALNPAFVFFSKFPVTETLAMAFSVNGFYLAAKAIRSENKITGVLLLTASAVLLGLYNFIRMSFLLFLPTMAAIFVVAFLLSDLQKYRRKILFFTAGIGVLFGLSWVYYYLYQSTLVQFIMATSYLPFIRKSLPYLVGIAAIFLVLAVLIWRYRSKADRITAAIIEKLRTQSTWLILAVLVLSILQVIQLCRAGYVVNGQVYIAGNEAFNFRFSGIYNFMLLVSPFAFCILLAAPFLGLRLSRMQLILVLTIAVIWLGLLQTGYSVILYKYYFTRYLTSEMLLYCIIFAAIALLYLLERGGRWRSIGRIVITCSAGYFLLFSAVQIGRAETDDPKIYYDLNSAIGSRDVIVSLLNQSQVFPLRFYFGKNVFQLGTTDDARNNAVVNELYSSRNYKNIYLLTYLPYESSFADCGLEPAGEYRYAYSFFLDGFHSVPYDNVKPTSPFQFLLPIGYRTDSVTVYLYKLQGKAGEFSVINHLQIMCAAAQD